MKGVWAVAVNVVREFFRRKDYYVILALTVVIVLLSSGYRFMGIAGATRYMRDLSLSLIWLFVLIITVVSAGRQLPCEIEKRTIYPLLAKPISRLGFIMGKFLGASLASIFGLTIFYAFFTVISAGQGTGWILILQSYYLQLLSVLLVASMVIFFSTFLTYGANVTLSFLVYFFIKLLGARLHDMAEQMAALPSFLCSALYFILPHFEFYDIKTRVIHMWPPVPAPAVTVLTVYTACYVAAFVLLAWIVFRRKVL
ncbi:MAG: hypothetical protein P9M00_12265 [Candidatus Tritonobacter lacicola]|nr:hypothetical protein [Candidatus Tritonobacter lacicola]